MACMIMTEPREISPEEVQVGLERGDTVRLVDVRQPWEYDLHHIPGALLIPLGELTHRFASELDPAEATICVCEHGVRSRNAAGFLISQGFKDVATMTGGMAQYYGPVETGPVETVPVETGPTESPT